jgi:hypothetical protein
MNDPGYMVVQSLTIRNTDYNEETTKENILLKHFPIAAYINFWTHRADHTNHLCLLDSVYHNCD